MPNRLPSYKQSPIGSLAALARKLGLDSESALLALASNVADFYRPGASHRKKDGTIRKTLKTIEPLRAVQAKIKTRILRNVQYPEYLMGSLPNHPEPRGPAANAQAHQGASIVMNFDVANFFPSISRAQVADIWQHLFNFPPDVAACLTNLTTHDDQLPQGVSTSSDLANLVFYNVEPQLVRYLSDRAITYTRYIDDITLSSQSQLAEGELSDAIRHCINLLGSRGYRSKRKKQTIAPKDSPQRVTGFNVNSGRPTVPKSKRNAVRAAIHQLEITPPEERASATYWASYRSASGRVRYLKNFHPRLANQLQKRLDKVPPQVSNDMVSNLRTKVARLAGAAAQSRKSHSFQKSLRRTRAEIGVIRHARPAEAEQLLTKLRDCPDS